ncbi:cytoplasmic protein [Nostoc sp.]|uniref:cytoplasmic protein n=1 Tax=Nostoc sp. TaxID=1180 RepID=UPI002FFD0D75
MDIKLPSQYSINNREQIEVSEKAGCYYCLSIFAPKKNCEYCDWGATVLCPKCGIDSVIGLNSGHPIDLETFKKLHQYWF